MNLGPESLRAIVVAGEGPRVEFKRGLPRPERVARSLAAFANTVGGLLVVGVTDRGEPWGVADPDGVVRRLRAVCAETLEPALAIEVTRVRLDGRAIVCCSVPLSPARPHRVLREGREPETVVRVGASNRVALGATLAALARPHAPRGSLGELERRVLAWVEERARRTPRPEGDATVRAFARAHNVGLQRARRTFTALERAGLLVGHGLGAARVFSRP